MLAGGGGSGNITEEFLQWLTSLIESGCLDPFYTCSQWRKLSHKVAEKQKKICQKCKALGIVKKYKVVHHIHHVKEMPHLALSEYDDEGNLNLIALCEECHYTEHHKKTGYTNEERW